MESLLPFLKIIVVFAAMLVGIRRKLGLGWSALGGSLLLALLFGQNPLQWCKLGLGIFTDRSILTVWLVIISVLTLSTLMEQTKQAERFMGAFSHRILSPRIRLVFFPMLIGLLPMPGGAVFSAPMISAVAKDLPVPEEDKSLINYWFRHTMEMTWFLYPALILAAALGSITTPGLAMWTAPMSLAFFAAGWWFYVRPLKIPAGSAQVSSTESGSVSNILRQGAPIFVALGGAVLFEALFAVLLPSVPLDYGVLLALALSVLVCLWQNHLGFMAFWKALCRPHVASMIFMVGALGVFKNVLADGGVVASLLVSGTGMAALCLAAILLCLLAGTLTGLMIACVGSVFPLIVALAPSLGEPLLPWMVMGLVSCLTGCMISPLHICFVLSCEYFNVDIVSSWRRLPMPGLLLWLCGLGYFLLLRSFHM